MSTKSTKISNTVSLSIDMEESTQYLAVPKCIVTVYSHPSDSIFAEMYQECLPIAWCLDDCLYKVEEILSQEVIVNTTPLGCNVSRPRLVKY